MPGRLICVEHARCPSSCVVVVGGLQMWLRWAWPYGVHKGLDSGQVANRQACQAATPDCELETCKTGGCQDLLPSRHNSEAASLFEDRDAPRRAPSGNMHVLQEHQIPESWRCMRTSNGA
ncbi:hypothetical protein PMIN04_008804 [Paraphaeosphaeria minitans]